MARSPLPGQDITQSIIADDSSDYGTEPDEAAYDLFIESQTKSPRLRSPALRQETVVASIEPIPVESQSRPPLVKQESTIQSIEDIPIPPEYEPLEQRIHLRLSRLQNSLDSVLASNSRIESHLTADTIREAAIEVEYDEENRRSFSPAPNEEEDAQRRRERELSPIPDEVGADGTKRSMLSRFRTKPKKPLSVTDLVSPAWCEQQYEYNLTKFGRVRATAAMKQGSSVHKKLEEQVHQVVPVETVSKEDKFALRIINTIEGLRALREDGLTREMEVFGVVEGEVVVGIIDEISTWCPDEEMEAAVLEEMRNPSPKGKAGKGGKKSEQLVEGQRTLTEFLTSSQNGSLLDSNEAFNPRPEPSSPTRRYYLKDVKTRQSPTLPTPGAASRPTHMQLMLYHRLLTSLAANTVPADTIFARYGLVPRNTFSDRFIAEIANLRIQPTLTQQSEGREMEDPLTELLEHNNLAALWGLMVGEFGRTFPTSPSPILASPAESPISPLLTAEYRTAASRRRSSNPSSTASSLPAGSLIGSRSFPLDSAVIDAYIRSEMAWWKGERETVGVEVSEAYKCGFCEFAEECTWRRTKVEEGLRKVEMRRVGRMGSVV